MEVASEEAHVSFPPYQPVNNAADLLSDLHML